ncbi:MAG: hypothetical protein ACK457_13245 [Flavobacteriia bacterium]|jgi:hypothetical protein
MKTITILFFLTAFSVSAQKDNGFYGKKFFIQPEFLFNNPLFYNLFSNDYDISTMVKSGNSLRIGKDKVNVGYRISAGYALKRNMVLGIEVGQDFSSFYPYRYGTVTDVWGSSSFNEIDHEMIDLTTFNIIPKIEFANSMALLPMGLSHTLGFGVALTKMVEKNYVYRYEDPFTYTLTTSNYNSSAAGTDPIEISKYPPLRKFVLMYGINMRTPITKNILISYGLKYTLNVGGKKGYTYPGVNQMLQSADVIEQINRQRKLTFIHLNLGLTYSF